MQYQYTTSGTCSRQITIDVDSEGIIRSVSFLGGCAGNLQGISRLAVGRKASEVMETLRGINCGPRPTSCPDQLSRALEAIMAQQTKEE